MAEKFYFLCVRLFGRLYSSNAFCNKLFGSSAVAFVKGRKRGGKRDWLGDVGRSFGWFDNWNKLLLNGFWVKFSTFFSELMKITAELSLRRSWNFDYNFLGNETFKCQSTTEGIICSWEVEIFRVKCQSLANFQLSRVQWNLLQP